MRKKNAKTHFEIQADNGFYEANTEAFPWAYNAMIFISQGGYK